MQNAQLLEDQLSHEEVFANHYSWLLAWSLRLNEGRHSEAEDLVHDLYIQLTRLRPRLRPDPDHIRGYLYTMLRNMHLSKLRRAQRSPICELLVIDYDSFEIGMRSIPERSLTAVAAQLWEVCEYMCERKKRSVSASALLLRFYIGYFPSEIVRVLKARRATVDKQLHAARREARLSVLRPQTFNIFRSRRSGRQLPSLPEDTQELFHLLRNRVFDSCEGECFSRETLQRIYAPSSFEVLRTAELAHLVSCRVCLDVLNQILGIRQLADRSPAGALGRDSGGPGGSSGSGSAPEFRQEAMRRLQEEDEHRPAYLQVAVNGEIRASHKITSELSEFYVGVGSSSVPDFIEIFSEQNIRLLYLPVNASGEISGFEEEAKVCLSDGRSLEVAIRFTDAPVISVRYHDPLFAEAETAAIPIPISMPDGGGRLDFRQRRGLRRLLPGRLNFPRGLWPAGAIATVSVALVVAAGIVAAGRRHSSILPAELLLQADRRAAAELPGQNLVRRTIRIEDRRDTGLSADQNSVVEWSSANTRTRARRLYNHAGALIAEEITRDGDTRFYGKVGEKKIIRMDPAHLQPEDVWQIAPSAEQFQSLIAPATPSAVEQESDRYEIRYRPPDGSRQAGLVEAMLVLRRSDLHPVEEDLVVRTDGEQHRFRLIEASYEYYAAAQAEKNVFAPDAILAQTPPDGVARSLPTGPLAAAEAGPEPAIHALYLLSQVRADMNGETDVQSAPDGTLRITGTVASRERREEILQALSGLRGQHGVLIDLRTPDEARGRGAEHTGTVEVIAPSAGTIPLDGQVRQYLSAQGISAAELDPAVARFSEEVLANADEARQHAWALEGIATRFSPAQLASLSPQARSEWVQMADMHSSALLRCVQAVRGQLAMLKLNQPAEEAGTESIGDVQDLSRAAEQMLRLSILCTRDLSTSFALSASPVAKAAVNNPEFWHSLDTLQSLARATADANHMLERAAVGSSR